MEAVFLKIFNMSICAGWLVLAVVVLRLLLTKAPKAIRVVLWGIVGLRLVWPFSIESVLSLIPSAQTVPADIGMARVPALQTGVPVLNSSINPILAENLAATPQYSANPMQILQAVAALVWVAGMAAMVLYAFVSWLAVRLRVREAVQSSGNIWLCDRIGSPFILGLVRPRIYLPPDMDEADKTYVLAHERAHLHRRDHLWKPLGFALLTVHWFNPLVWLAYILLCRDIELACDEKVIGQLGEAGKKPYSQALINCSVPRHLIAACPVAFGENGVKGRIQSVLHYKKPAFWVIMVAVIVCIAVAVCFLTDPKQPAQEPDMTQPPTLRLTEPSGNSVEGFRTGYDWADGEERMTENISVTSLGSLPLLDMLPIIYSHTKGNTVTLDFTVMPDSVKVSTRTVAQTEDALQYYVGWSPDTAEVPTFDALEGTHVYTVTAQWEGYGTCTYAFRGRVNTPQFGFVPSELDKLRVDYPQYFDLPTDKGLEVCIWQMAKDSYSCVLLPGNAPEYTQLQLAQMPAVTIEQMRLILSTYAVGREQVTLTPVQLLVSSYGYKIDADYIADLEQRFWGDGEDRTAADLERIQQTLARLEEAYLHTKSGIEN